MGYRFLADALVVFHLCFVLFVIGGGLLVLKWRGVALLHVPAVMWGIWVECSGWMCPLTPLENQLREWGGGVMYEGSFVEHYIMPVLYPVELTRDFQITLGAVIALINVLVYAAVFSRATRRIVHGRATGAISI